MDKFQAIKVFLEIVRSGSFSKAAQELGLSTTATSRLLQTLEDQIGVRLLHRSTRNLSLTEAGETLHAHYARIMGELEAIETEVPTSLSEIKGLLRVALPHTFGTRFMQTLFRDFRALYPSVELDIGLSDSRVDLVQERVDVALRITRELEPDVVAKRLTTIRVAICAAPAYLERHGEPSTPADLRNHACLLYTGNNPADEWQFDGPDGHIVQRIQGVQRSNNGEILREAALSGAGIIIQPTFLIGEDLRAGRLVRILKEYEPTGLTAYAIYLHRNYLPRTVRTFVDFLAQRFAEAPWWDEGP